MPSKFINLQVSCGNSSTQSDITCGNSIGQSDITCGNSTGSSSSNGYAISTPRRNVIVGRREFEVSNNVIRGRKRLRMHASKRRNVIVGRREFEVSNNVIRGRKRLRMHASKRRNVIVGRREFERRNVIVGRREFELNDANFTPESSQSDGSDSYAHISNTLPNADGSGFNLDDANFTPESSQSDGSDSYAHISGLHLEIGIMRNDAYGGNPSRPAGRNGLMDIKEYKRKEEERKKQERSQNWTKTALDTQNGGNNTATHGHIGGNNTATHGHIGGNNTATHGHIGGNNTATQVPNPRNNIENQEYAKKNRCNWTKKHILCVVVIGLFILAAVIGPIVIWRLASDTNNQYKGHCVIDSNSAVCPLDDRSSTMEIRNPKEYLEEGYGKTITTLTKNADKVVDGFIIHVEDAQLHVTKHPANCQEATQYSFNIRDANDTTIDQFEIDVKYEDSRNLEMELTAYIDSKDNKEHVQITCTGYLLCGTPVLVLHMQVAGYGTVDEPMECSKTTDKGQEDVGAFECICNMTAKRFRRTEKISCRGTVELLEGVAAKPVSPTNVNVTEASQVHFVLEQGKSDEISWKVDVQSNNATLPLQTEFNGRIYPNTADTPRVRMFASVEKNIATIVLNFTPVTCADNGHHKLTTQGGYVQKIHVEVTGLPSFISCPTVQNVSVGDRMMLNCTYCLPDSADSYRVDMFGRPTESGSFFTNAAAVKISDESILSSIRLRLNMLTVEYTKLRATCSDHGTAFNMSILSSAGTITHEIYSMTNVIADKTRYGNDSTGGSFLENTDGVISFRLHLGCRPQHMSVVIDGDTVDVYNLTEDDKTGEKLFIKTFTYSPVIMKDNGTRRHIDVSFINDAGQDANISVTDTVLVIRENFCEDKSHGCNYKHPYKKSDYVSCGDGVIASIRPCPTGHGDLVFDPSSDCRGKCCPEGSVDNCRHP